jgi:hypothetical protein
VPPSFEIGVANVIERLHAGVACAVPAFLGKALHYPGQRSRPFEFVFASACCQAWMAGFSLRRRYRKGIKER